MTVSKKARIGALNTIEEIKTAIRDLENALGVLTDEVVSTTQDTPASTQIVVAKNDGDFEIWDVVSGGGCTITKDALNKRLTISVP